MKRIGSIVIALLFILTAVYTLPSTYAADNRLRGDADRNGEVTLPDSTLIQYVLSEIEDYDLDEQAADVNGDETVDITDATLIQRYLLGFDNPYQIDEIIGYSDPTTPTTSVPTTSAPTTPTPTRDPYELPFIPNH